MGIQWLMVGMIGGFQLVMGVHPMVDFHGKIPFSKVDDDWGYPHDELQNLQLDDETISR